MEYIPAKTILSGYREQREWFGCHYNMHLYRGCCHGCVYCDSPVSYTHLHEVVNGAAKRSDCTVAVIPCGSGNDYVKNFGSADAFTDLERLVQGAPRPVDLLDCSGEYAVNLCNIGFDARVAHHMSKFKRIPFVSGPLAYTLSLLFCLLGQISRCV